MKTPWTYEVHELSEGNSAIVYDCDGVRVGTDHLTEAEASLIAAAPDMYEALKWYAEQARLARLIHSEGDKGRQALANDGGQKAHAALAKVQP